jgi:flotillin
MVNMNPRTVKTVVNAMTTEKIPFNMPMTFTICPIDTPEALKVYAARMCGIDEATYDENLLGIIQGESRILTAEMELEKLFNDRDNFKHQITDKINGLLEEFGLRAMNVNIEELIDNDGSEYFKYMKKKALEKAVNKARVDVAEQTKEGDIGEKEHVRTSRKKMAEIEADAVTTENEKQREILSSTTDLEIAKSNFTKSRQIAEYQAQAEAEMRQIEFQQTVEEKRRAQKIEEKRATDFSSALVAAEVKAKDMEGVMAAEKHRAETQADISVIQARAQLEKFKLDAEAQLFQQQKVAEAHLYEEQRNAEAYLLTKKAEADGITLLRAAEARGIEQVKLAEAKGLEQLILASGGNVESLSKYLMITNGTIVDVAKEQANSLLNMKPTIWVNGTGNNGANGGGSSLSDTMQDLMRNAVPLNDVIRAQTGVDFLGSLNVKRDAPNDSH